MPPIKDLVKYLEDEISFNKEHGADLDSRDWNNDGGITITSNEAEALLDIYRQVPLLTHGMIEYNKFLLSKDMVKK